MSDSDQRRAEAIYAIWQDPTTYNAYRHGPPYLPGLPFDREASAKQGSEAPMGTIAEAPLGALVAGLRALAFIHQTYHWQTRGKSFYADHQLFERLYNESLGQIDKLAEKAVFIESEGSVDGTTQVAAIGEFIRAFYVGASYGPEQMIEATYQAERRFLELLNTVRSQLQAGGDKPTTGQLPSGLDNLLQEIADTHEGFMYLLGQRSKVANRTATTKSYDYRRTSK